MVWWTDVGPIIEDTDPATVAELKAALRYATDWIKAMCAVDIGITTRNIPPNVRPAVTCGQPVGGTEYLDRLQKRPVVIE